MKRTTALTLIAALAFFSACSKHTSGPSAGYGPNSLFPTTAGDTWYFIDSAWADTAGNLTLYTYNDTMVATKNAIQDQGSGTVYLGMNNPYGWFAGSYIAVDPSNYYVYEADSATGLQPYTMFGIVSSDGLIGPESDNWSNPACEIVSKQIGYANPVTINGFSCYQNTEVTTDCKGTVLEETDIFLSPGVGPVRIDDWMTDSTGKFYEDYSQTLTAKNLH